MEGGIAKVSWVNHFWELSLDGEYDKLTHDDGVFIRIKPSHRRMYPELSGHEAVILHERESGIEATFAS